MYDLFECLWLGFEDCIGNAIDFVLLLAEFLVVALRLLHEPFSDNLIIPALPVDILQ